MDTNVKNGRNKELCSPSDFAQLLRNLRSKKIFAGNGTGRIYSTRKSSKRKGGGQKCYRNS